MTTFEEVLAQVEQLSAEDQARLVARLSERIQQALELLVGTDDPSSVTQVAGWEDSDAERAALDAEWDAIEAQMAAERQHPPSREEAAAVIEQIFKGGRRIKLSEAQAEAIAMSEDVSEWNLPL